MRVTIHYELEYTSVTFFVIIERVYCVIALYYHIVEFWCPEVLLIFTNSHTVNSNIWA